MRFDVRYRGILALFIAIATPFAATAESRDTCYTFAVVPQQNAVELARRWTPFLSRVAKDAGAPLCFATAPDIQTFYQRLEAGEYDFAYMNPYQYVLFHRLTGYTAFARERGQRLQGIVVVRKDSSIADLQDLAGQEVVFPSPTSFAAFILVQAELRQRGIPIQPRFVASHESAYRNVAGGFFAAAGGIPRTLGLADDNTRESLRILWTSRPYSPHPIAHHPRIRPEVVTAMLRSMVRVAAGPGGPGILSAIGFKGIEPGQDADWDDIRHLQIDQGTIHQH
jgi:phosphonate transport system substrate-binding protein